MKTTNLIFLTAIMTVVAITTFAADPVGTIVSFSGKATATAQNGELRNLTLKSPVFLNDRIKTDSASSLQIMFLDDSVLSQGEKSEMTIDEYVYNPKVKEDNKCTLNLTKGVFRAVTARITMLNPDRFKVKTRLATIGIRGCELAFTITERGENIYVLSLPDGKSITITIDPVAAAGMNLTGILNKEGIIAILQAGTMISIQEGEGVTQRLITSEEAINLIEELFNNINQIDDANQHNHGHVLNEDKKKVINSLTPTTTTTTTPTPTTTTQPTPALVYTRMGPGVTTDWEWGVWAYPGTTPEKVDFNAPCLLCDTEVASLFYACNLMTSAGDAAAIVQYNGSRYFVSGTCSIHVNMMSTPPGTWSVSGSLLDSKETTTLNLNISGSVLSSGQLVGSLPYLNNSLTVGSTTFSTADMSGSDASARLVGSGGVPSGVIGRFHGTFGSGAAVVDGGFGGSTVNAPF